EDSGYSKLLRPLLKTEHAIGRVLYHYDYSDVTTETQQHKRGRMRVRKQRPLVDVVILSNADRPGLAQMTQDTIKSCIAGANSLPINVVVMEQQAHSYRFATTVRCPGEFNYNRFCNRGAALGDAEWILFANNDLVFHDGWLHQLLAADHPVVSPKCPLDPRQAEILENTTGTYTARHLSGWCFMMRRELWQQIGGLDDCVSFWCSDDVVIEQLKLVGVEPMLVVDSVVEHLQSATLKHQPAPDELTWKQIDIFNRKYGRHRMAADRRFRAWERRNAHTG
ncbi:MAG TPA: hypothetical protein VJ777_07085, partial [Mycobacterium sp.]|nr:hypothetical protein [Mycobacterium sp.]